MWFGKFQSLSFSMGTITNFCLRHEGPEKPTLGWAPNLPAPFEMHPTDLLMLRWHVVVSKWLWFCLPYFLVKLMKVKMEILGWNFQRCFMPLKEEMNPLWKSKSCWNATCDIAKKDLVCLNVLISTTLKY